MTAKQRFNKVNIAQAVMSSVHWTRGLSAIGGQFLAESWTVRFGFIVLMPFVANAQGQAFTNQAEQPSQAERLAMQYGEFDCGVLTADAKSQQADDNQKLYCQYLIESILSGCGNNNNCLTYQGWASSLPLSIKPGSSTFEDDLKVRADGFRRSYTNSSKSTEQYRYE
ncbi:hypothetical protein ACI2KR_21415 [Pseudomonas luteola]